MPSRPRCCSAACGHPPRARRTGRSSTGSARSCPPPPQSRRGEPARQAHQVEECDQHAQLEQQTVVPDDLRRQGSRPRSGQFVPVQPRVRPGSRPERFRSGGDRLSGLRPFAAAQRRLGGGPPLTRASRNLLRGQRVRRVIDPWAGTGRVGALFAAGLIAGRARRSGAAAGADRLFFTEVAAGATCSTPAAQQSFEPSFVVAC